LTLPRSTPREKVLDTSLSFDRFVVGATNELAVAATKRAAESPGAVYNPLLICGRSGIGKTHLLHATGQYATALEPDIAVHLESGDIIAHRVTQGVVRGDLAPFVESLMQLDMLLIDEIERLSGMERTQEELGAIVNRMTGEGRQVVMASVFPPSHLPGFTPAFIELLNRGLVVDIGEPDVAMRRTLVQGFARERWTVLPEDVMHRLAKHEFPDARSIRTAVYSILEWAAVEYREADLDDVAQVIQQAQNPRAAIGEFDSFLHDVSRTLATVVETAPWRRRIAESILKWEGEGIRTQRLEEMLLTDTPPDVDTLLDDFARDATRLIQVRQELLSLGVHETLDDPADLARAEGLLAAARADALPATGANGRRPAVDAMSATVTDQWFLNPDKVVLDWIDLEGRLVVEPG
jgi:hypothetical protein